MTGPRRVVLFALPIISVLFLAEIVIALHDDPHNRAFDAAVDRAIADDADFQAAYAAHDLPKMEAADAAANLDQKNSCEALRGGWFTYHCTDEDSK